MKELYCRLTNAEVKKSIKKLIDRLKECGYTDGKIIIAHNNNEAGALELKNWLKIHLEFLMERFKKQEPFAVITQSHDPFSSVLKHPFVTINHIKIDF